MASIVTLVDLEWECIQFLQSFEVPTLSSLHPAQHPIALPVDPNEVDLEDLNTDQPSDTEPETERTISRFEDYGVGTLLHHPVVWSYFGGILAIEDSSNLCSQEKVLQILIEFLSEQKWQHNTNKFSNFDANEFIEYLCAELSISHPAEAGILIRGNLEAERIALEHVVKNRYTLYVETTKCELEHFNQQMQLFQGNGRKTAKKRRKRRTDEANEALEVPEEENAESVQETKQKDEEVSEDIRDNGTDNTITAREPESTVVSIPGVNASVSVTTESCASTTVLAAAPARRKRNINPVDPPYEASMNVYLPSGLPSITSNGAFKAGISPCGDADPAIRIVENWELQPILPYVNLDSGTNTDINNTQLVNAAWTQSVPTNTFNPALDGRAAGRWGEALVYQYLLATAAPGSNVNWLNVTEESRACYDFIVTAPLHSHRAQIVASRMHFNQDYDTNSSILPPSSTANGRESTEYIEVKSTRFADRNMFEISPNEWQFAAADSRVPYHIYRVFSAGDPQRVRLVIIEDIFRKVTEGRLKLCMAV